jgi:hypothetical protein
VHCLRDELIAALERVARRGQKILHRLDARTDFQTGLLTLSLRAREEAQGSCPLWWCIDGRWLILGVRLCGEFGGQDGFGGL